MITTTTVATGLIDAKPMNGRRYLEKRWLIASINVVLGGLLVLGYAPYQLTWMPYVVLTALAYVWSHLSPKAAAHAAFYWGVGYFGFGMY